MERPPRKVRESIKPSRAYEYYLLPLAWIGRPVEFIWKLIVGVFDYVGQIIILAAQTLYYIITLRIPVNLTIQQMAHLGSDSLFIVMLCLGFAGMIFATILTQQAMDLGFGTQYIGGAVAYAMATDLAPVLGCMVLAGRAGAGIASEIGTMVVTEQIDALRALAVPPVRHLVVPRFLACAIMVPAVIFIAGFLGVWASWYPTNLVPGASISYRLYFYAVFNAIDYSILWTTFKKSLYFGMIIALVPSIEGFATKGGAKGVGVTVTRAVVITMVCIFIADLILTL